MLFTQKVPKQKNFFIILIIFVVLVVLVVFVVLAILAWRVALNAALAVVDLVQMA